MPASPITDFLMIRPQLAAARQGTRKPRRGARIVAGGGAENTRAAKGAAGARARYAGAVPAADGNRVNSAPTAPAAPAQADATKILISNLPTDVNEPQVKVRSPDFKGSRQTLTLIIVNRNYSLQLSAQLAKSPSLTTPKGVPKVLPPLRSAGVEMRTRHLPNTMDALSMGVSIHSSSSTPSKRYVRHMEMLPPARIVHLVPQPLLLDQYLAMPCPPQRIRLA